MHPPKAGFITFSKLLHLLLVSASVVVLIKVGILLSTAQSEERKLKNKEFAGMPVRVRKVKNVQSETWPRDLEIEIENVSNKPIYFINGVLAFPDDPAPDGISGILLQYGKLENLDIAKLADPEDEHLDPGKTVTLVVSDVYRNGLLAKQKRAPGNLKKLEFWFDTISFGDGTGFQLSEFVDVRKKKADPSQKSEKSSLKKKEMKAGRLEATETTLPLLRLETAVWGVAINIKLFRASGVVHVLTRPAINLVVFSREASSRFSKNQITNRTNEMTKARHEES